eukprot:7343287-Heterocapsa_arctica.AAC.1
MFLRLKIDAQAQNVVQNYRRSARNLTVTARTPEDRSKTFKNLRKPSKTFKDLQSHIRVYAI